MSTVNKEDTPKGHWTKEVPTKPGWYKADISEYLGCDPDIDFVRVEKDCVTKLRGYITGQVTPITLANIEWWWSEPEDLPDLPEEAL